jgi:hypothetical protein
MNDIVNFCPDCGGSLQPDFRFCPDCGATVDGVHAPPAYGNKDLGKAHIILRILGFLGLGLGMFTFVTGAFHGGGDALGMALVGSISAGIGIAILVADRTIGRYRAQSEGRIAAGTIGNALITVAGGIAVTALLVVLAAGAAFVFFFVACLVKLQ